MFDYDQVSKLFRNKWKYCLIDLSDHMLMAHKKPIRIWKTREFID